MRLMLAVWILFAAPLTLASSLVELEVHDVTGGYTLPLHEFRGRAYVAGEPGHRYELRLRNRSGQRVLAVTSVDGVNVVSGETAAAQQRGYVLEPWSSVTIDGWRKSLDEVAAFYFTSLPDSYAARTGRPLDVGVIGVAVFCEKPRRALAEQRARGESSEEADAPAASRSGARDQRQTLGTGHGERRASPAQYVDFQRASSRPVETISIWYDSYRNLAARGVLPSTGLVHRHARAFPGEFVPDP